MCARDNNDELEDEFETRVRRQKERIEQGRREKGQSFWKYVGLIGVVGWGVAVPTAVGVLLGLWIDRRYDTGSRWTLILLVLGLCMGCLNAWRMITKEH
jgi:ATP synthase protein I